MINDRQKKILEKLLIKKKVTVKELASELYASEPTIRRDLVQLEAQGLIKRTHGGAMLMSASIEAKIPFLIREMEQFDAKTAMAEKALELIHDHDTIFLDASSSAYNIIPFLPLRNHLLVITSGVKALTTLNDYDINTISTGGKLLLSCLSLVGEEAYATIRRFHADVVFFSCRGLSLDGELTDMSASEVYVRQEMIRHSKRAYLLCSHNKIGQQYTHSLCHAEELDGIISETAPPEGMKETCLDLFL